jgi:hypothetical protein
VTATRRTADTPTIRPPERIATTLNNTTARRRGARQRITNRRANDERERATTVHRCP